MKLLGSAFIGIGKIVATFLTEFGGCAISIDRPGPRPRLNRAIFSNPGIKTAKL